MDTGFIDLDILLTRIRNGQSRIYFLDAVKAYKAGALRASLTSIWVALVFDLIAKYRELSSLGDRSATKFIQSWDTATDNNNIKTLLELEGKILDHATSNTQVISHLAKKHLNRIKEDRNLCAHPAFSGEAELFEPSSELVRLHLFNAVDLVLSQEPLQGKTIIDQFNVDVQSTGFPIAHEKIVDYVEQRYLRRVRPSNINNFGKVLAKSLLKGMPQDWENQRKKIIYSLVAVRDRAPEAWPEVSSAIAQVIDNIEPPNRLSAIAFIAAFPDFLEMLQPTTVTTLEGSLTNIVPADFDEYRVLAGLKLTQFRIPLLDLIAGFNEKQLMEAIAEQPFSDLWPSAVDCYGNSSSFRQSEDNFRNFISPFAGQLDSTQLGQLLDAVMEEGQNWSASATGDLLSYMLRNASEAQLPDSDARNRFFQHHGYISSRSSYVEVRGILESDGWKASERQQTSAE